MRSSLTGLTRGSIALILTTTLVVLFSSTSTPAVEALKCECNRDGPHGKCSEDNWCEVDGYVWEDGVKLTPFCAAIKHPRFPLYLGCTMATNGESMRVCRVNFDPERNVTFEKCWCNKDFCNRGILEPWEEDRDDYDEEDEEDKKEDQRSLASPTSTTAAPIISTTTSPRPVAQVIPRRVPSTLAITTDKPTMTIPVRSTAAIRTDPSTIDFEKEPAATTIIPNVIDQQQHPSVIDSKSTATPAMENWNLDDNKEKEKHEESGGRIVADMAIHGNLAIADERGGGGDLAGGNNDDDKNDGKKASISSRGEGEKWDVDTTDDDNSTTTDDEEVDDVDNSRAETEDDDNNSIDTGHQRTTTTSDETSASETEKIIRAGSSSSSMTKEEDAADTYSGSLRSKDSLKPSSSVASNREDDRGNNDDPFVPCRDGVVCNRNVKRTDSYDNNNNKNGAVRSVDGGFLLLCFCMISATVALVRI